MSTSRCICATQTPHSLVSAPGFCHLSTTRRAITPRSSLKQASKTAVSTDRVANFFDEVHTRLPFPLNEKHHLPLPDLRHQH